MPNLDISAMGAMTAPPPEENPEKIAKAAKATKEMFLSMLKASFTALGLQKLFQTITDTGENPAIQVLNSFFEYLKANIDKEFVDLAVELVKNLFGPETRAAIKETSAEFHKVNDALAWFVSGMNKAHISIVDLVKATSPLYVAIQLLTAQWKIQLQTFKDLNNAVDKATSGLRDFIEKVSDFWETVRGD